MTPEEVLQECQYLDKYSRLLPNGERETWQQAVDRTVSFLRELSNNRLSDRDYDFIRRMISEKKAMPSMRLLAMAGEAARRTNVSIFNCSYMPIDDPVTFKEAVLILMSGTGLGYSVERKYTDRLPEVTHQTGATDNYGVPDTTEGWSEAIYRGVMAWLRGRDVAFDLSQIRPEGTPLKTKGGIASGPQHLQKALERIKEVILLRQGRHLRPLDVHDLMCHIADAVVSGGVRRSAMIVLFDAHDNEMLTCKSGDNINGNTQRWNANNSMVISGYKPLTFWHKYLAGMHDSQRGEPGIFSRYALENTLPSRRKLDGGNVGTNPCVTGDTWVMTQGGARQVTDLLNTPFVAMVDGRPYQSTERGFWKTGDKRVFRVETKEGYAISATGDHPVMTIDAGWKQVSQLVPGDKIRLNNHADLQWGKSDEAEKGWLIGSLVGDGCFTRGVGNRGDIGHLRYWGDEKQDMFNIALQYTKNNLRHRKDLTGIFSEINGYMAINCVDLARLANDYGITPNDKHITTEIERQSSSFIAGYLRGLFDADGTVGGTLEKSVSVRLSQNSYEFLLAIQRMLTRFGIRSTVHKNRHTEGMKLMPNGKGGLSEYWCKATHDLIISRKSLLRYRDRIGFNSRQKATRLDDYLSIVSPYNDNWYARVTNVTPEGVQPVYDCSIPGINAFDANGLYVHNCGEIVLKATEFCNLSSAVCRVNDTPETLAEKVIAATIIGTIQSMATNYPELRPQWADNGNEERLLGVDLMGVMDCPAIRDAVLLQELRQLAIRVNREYAERLDINPSVSITCSKPSGNSSVLLDASPGIHARWSPYYIRRVTFVDKNPIRKALAKAGVPMERKKGTDNQWVVSFPVKSPEGAICTGDLSAIEQLDNWKLFKLNWTEHNPSCTVTYQPHELEAMGGWLFANQAIIGGLSFLPRFDAQYEQMPYEAITAAEYDVLLAEFPLDVDLSHIKGVVNVAATPGCDSDICELPVR